MLVFSKDKFIEDSIRNGGLTELDQSCIDSWVTRIDGFEVCSNTHGFKYCVICNDIPYPVVPDWCIEK